MEEYDLEWDWQEDIATDAEMSYLRSLGVNNKSHTYRWDRALLAFGETVADASLTPMTPMTAAEARRMAGRYQASRWNPVAEALREIEAGGSG